MDSDEPSDSQRIPSSIGWNMTPAPQTPIEDPSSNSVYQLWLHNQRQPSSTGTPYFNSGTYITNITTSSQLTNQTQGQQIQINTYKQQQIQQQQDVEMADDQKIKPRIRFKDLGTKKYERSNYKHYLEMLQLDQRFRHQTIKDVFRIDEIQHLVFIDTRDVLNSTFQVQWLGFRSWCTLQTGQQLLMEKTSSPHRVFMIKQAIERTYQMPEFHCDSKKNKCGGMKYCPKFHEEDMKAQLDSLDENCQMYFNYGKVFDELEEMTLVSENYYMLTEMRNYFYSLNTDQQIEFALSFYNKYSNQFENYQEEFSNVLEESIRFVYKNYRGVEFDSQIKEDKNVKKSRGKK
ncbi:UNKNOWN [Stylonychia lemnae]|uniref:Uncharacterized protein n=1 Tax=Stylonychia lemnae TaxID=5949 RepID=A0A078AGG5_STYLE|nr:UNKNOWN [Stylonychia lemnae]|eukprot:CDW79938.1 UNKNOWN [Stylonychia lemnae]